MECRESATHLHGSRGLVAPHIVGLIDDEEVERSAHRVIEQGDTADVRGEPVAIHPLASLQTCEE
jgi:hypothetical protein